MLPGYKSGDCKFATHNLVVTILVSRNIAIEFKFINTSHVFHIAIRRFFAICLVTLTNWTGFLVLKNKEKNNNQLVHLILFMPIMEPVE